MAARRNDSTVVDDYIPIRSLEHAKQYNQIFFVADTRHNDKMRTGTGIPFTRVTLRDITGEIEGVVWGYGDDGQLTAGCYARIPLETKIYKDEIEFQARINDIEICDAAPVNRHDYVRGVSDEALSSYVMEVQLQLEDIEDDHYRDILGNAMHRLDLMHLLRSAPYGLSGPMAYTGGLLVHVAHSLRFCQVAIGQARELETGLSPSLVIAGCALRNIGWSTTTRFQGDYLRARDAYHMTGVYRAGARFIDHLMLTTEGDLQISIPESKKQALENVCNPMADINTLEGKMVAAADNMADTLAFGTEALCRKQRGSWRNEFFVGHLS